PRSARPTYNGWTTPCCRHRPERHGDPSPSDGPFPRGGSPSPPGGTWMTPTRVRTLVIVAAVCAIVAWLLLRQAYSSLPPLPWTLPWPPSTWSTAAVSPPPRTGPESRRTADPPVGPRSPVHVAHDEEHRAQDGRQVRDPARRQQFGKHLDIAERGRAQLQPPGRLAAPGDEVVPVDPERVLRPGVGVALGHLEDLGQPGAQWSRRQGGQPAGARIQQIQRCPGLVQQALEPGQAVAVGPGDHPQHVG